MAQLFWIAVIFVGLIGALADVVLNQWSKTLSFNWFAGSATLYVAFMAGFGLVIRIGATREYPLTIAMILVLLVSIASVGVWDLLVIGTHFTLLQVLGAILATVAMFCFELGRK